MKKINRYVLDQNGNPVQEPNLLRWANWFEHSMTARIVKQEQVGDLRVSTVFLGLDHNYGTGEPILWETMVFDDDGYQERCSGNREQAEAMHAKVVERVKNQLTTKPE